MLGTPTELMAAAGIDAKTDVAREVLAERHFTVG
jgi:hypothetical protein